MQANSKKDAKGKIITITRAVINRYTSVEIQLDKAQMQAYLIVYRVPLLGKSPVAETHGPCGSFGELREHLHWLFGQATAESVCHPNHEKKIA